MSQLVELLLDALYQIILPIFLVLGVGFVVGRKLFLAHPAEAPDQPLGDVSHQRHMVPAFQNETGRANSSLRTLSSLVFYVFTPCLAFSSLAGSDVGVEEVGRIGLFVVVTTLVIGGITWALARLLHLSPPDTSSLLLVAMFGNVGNYGLPFNELAFGQRGLERAVIYMVVSSVLIFSLGILVAARVQGSAPSQMLSRMAHMPIAYALLLAGLVRLGVLSVPDPVLKSVAIIAQGTVPLMLLILGMQLSEVHIQGKWRLIGLVSGVRLLLAPLIALPLAGLLGLTGLPAQVSIIEASMPSAVYAIILSIEFDLALDLTTGVVFLTTLVSPLTLIPLVSYLR